MKSQARAGIVARPHASINTSSRIAVVHRRAITSDAASLLSWPAVFFAICYSVIMWLIFIFRALTTTRADELVAVEPTALGISLLGMLALVNCLALAYFLLAWIAEATQGARRTRAFWGAHAVVLVVLASVQVLYWREGAFIERNRTALQVLHHINVADTLCRKGAMDEALVECDIALAFEFNNEQALRTRVRLLEKQGRFDDAVADRDSLINLGFGNWDDFRVRGHWRCDTGAKDAALRDFKQARALYRLEWVKFAEYIADIHYGEAACRFGLKDYGGALRSSEDALAAYPDGWRAREMKGRALSLLGRPREAVAAYCAAAEAKPDSPVIFYHRGLTYEQLGDMKSAIADLERAARLDPDGWIGTEARAVIEDLKQKHEDL